MDVKFGHAIYGEHERGHRLLRASPLFVNAAALAGRMDRQGTPPPHTEWRPYLSAFAWQDSYILARTVPDLSASRPGMVFSRAFAIPGADIARVDDILGMIELLIALGVGRDAIDDIPFRPAQGALVKDAGLIRAVLSNASAPLVWPGQEGFEPALAGLWKGLWPAARRALSTKIAFTPNDVAGDAPTLVTTPTGLLSRWSGMKIIAPDPGGALTTPAERYLAGIDRNAIQNALVDAFGDDTRDIAEIQRLVDMESSLHDGATFADSLDALRLAGHLGATIDKGEAIKRGLIDRAAKAMAEAGAAEIRMARNLDLSAFATRSDFWAALVEWAQNDLWQDRNAASAAQVISDAWSGKPEAEWCAAVIKGSIAALSRAGTALIARLWGILAAQPTLLTPIVQGCANARALEAALVKQLPARLSADTLAQLSGQTRVLGLTELHAVSCAAAFPPVEAIRQHLSDMAATEESVRLAARKANGQDLVTVALAHDDVVTLALAAEAAAAAPKLLKRLDVTVPRWRDLWSGALARNPQAALGPADPSAAVSTLLSGIAAGTMADIALVVALSASPLADLAHMSERESLWDKLPEPARSAYLEATAKGWVTAVERGDVEPAEPVLAQYLMSPIRLDALLAQLATRPGAGCALFRALPQIREARCESWLREVLRRNTPLVFEDAATIGLLASSRNWSSVAREIADAITEERREDLRPAVPYIVELLSWYRRYLLDESRSKMPMAAKWQVLEEVTVELYGHGPSDHDLWQRAGGKDKDIPKGGSGGSRWRKVFAEARKGKAAIDIAMMIKCMYEDYPNYRPVQVLRWDTAFGPTL